MAGSAMQSVNIQAWPLSISTAQPFASVSYNSTHASISSSSTPSIPSEDSIVRIGYSDPITKQWHGVATSASNFDAGKQHTLLLHLDQDDSLYHIGFRASDLTVSQRKSKDESTQSRLRAEVVPIAPAPQVQMNKPVVLNADGQVAAPPEKTFLQKYWWAIGLFLVLQIVMSGGEEEKKK